MTELVLQAEGITIRYGGVVAVNNVNLSLQKGEIHGVIGPNGAGKSSLLDGISGRCKLSAGTVRQDGLDVTKDPVHVRRRNGMARSFQTTSVYGSLTVAQQLAFVARRVGDEGLKELISELNLKDLLAHKCSDISYGEQRSVDVALALVGWPRVVLMDEPGAGLSHDESITVLSHIRSLCETRGVSVVLVEHDVDAVFSVSDVVTVLSLGTTLASGDPATIRKDPRVIEAYLGSKK